MSINILKRKYDNIEQIDNFNILFENDINNNIIDIIFSKLYYTSLCNIFNTNKTFRNRLTNKYIIISINYLYSIDYKKYTYYICCNLNYKNENMILDMYNLINIYKLNYDKGKELVCNLLGRYDYIPGNNIIFHIFCNTFTNARTIEKY